MQRCKEVLSNLALIIAAIAPSAAFAAPPTVTVIEGAILSRSNGDSIIESGLRKLADDYGVTITDKVLAGYILDLNDRNNDSYDGFDITAKYAHPFFARYFHNPAPKEKDSKRETDQMWAYATKGVKPDRVFKAYSAVALTEIDHVYFGSTKFGQGYYVPQKGAPTDFGFESILHEALHIWQSHHANEVSELLHSRGSYFDRLKLSNELCPDFKKVSGGYDSAPKPVCGFRSRQGAILAVLRQTKWPQRYGSLTDRKHGLIRKGEKCSFDQSYTKTVNSDLVCFTNGYSESVGDLHAIDNDMEYFAILMQLSIFSPKDFELVATEREKLFARDLFARYFRQSDKRSDPTSKKSGSVR